MPPYAPNTQNQTVDYGGFRWKGYPGQVWTQVGVTGQNGSDNQGYNAQGQMTDPIQIAAEMQKQQVAANQPAIATLQGQGTTLADQYKTLLADINGQGQQTYNTATSGENAYLGQRGLLSQSGLGNNQLSQAQSGVAAQNAVNQQNVTTAGAGVQSQIAQQIAALQAGNLPQAENFAQSVYNTQAGITNTNTAQNVALQSAQLAAAKPFEAAGGLVFNPSSNNFTKQGGGYGGGGDNNAQGMDINKLAEIIAGMSKNKTARQPASTISQFIQPS